MNNRRLSSNSSLGTKKVKFSEQKISDMRQAFRLFDKEGNGIITTQEIGNVLRNLGLFPTDVELNEMLKEIDINGDGEFSFDEFVQLMYNMGNLAEISEEHEEEELREAFKVFDKTGNGYITINDLRSVLQSLGEQLTEDEIEDMIAEVDIDNDGKIDFDEFVASLKAERKTSDDDCTFEVKEADEFIE